MRKHFLVLCLLTFWIGFTVSSETCNDTNSTSESVIVRRCCRDGRDGRDGVSVMGSKGPRGCKGEPGHNGTVGKQGERGSQGPPGKFDDPEMMKLLDSIRRKSNLQQRLVGHWTMDEAAGDFVDDNSGNELHGTTDSTKTISGKYTRGRYIKSGLLTDGYIRVSHNPIMNFGTNSFSFCGWLKTLDYGSDLSNLALQKGLYCSGKSHEKGANVTAGWSIGEVFRGKGTKVCLRDLNKNYVHDVITHDVESYPLQLFGKWTHYAVIFDRSLHRIRLYINGKKQRNEINIGNVIGSVDNDLELVFGKAGDWRMKGMVDEFRIYNDALTTDDVMTIYKNHRV